MNLLSNLSIKSKLIIAALIPLIAIIYYLKLNISAEQKAKENAIQAISDVERIREISNLIHELQKERALTLAFLSGGNANTRNELSEQRDLTNRAVFSMERELDVQNYQLETTFSIDSLSAYRAHTNAIESVNKIDSFYFGLKTDLLNKVAEIYRLSNSLTLKNYFEDHLYLLHTKDFLASMRSELGSMLAANEFTEKGYGRFAVVKGKHEFNLQKFKKTASPELLDFFNSKFSGPFVQRTYALIDSAFLNASLAGIHLSSETWWENATQSINSLKEVEDYSSLIIKLKADEEFSAAAFNLKRNTVIAVVVILIIILVVAFTVYGIIRSINSIKVAAEKMAKGDLNMSLNIRNKDEVGALAESFNQMIYETRNFSVLADAIGKGDYSRTVQIRSKEDTLGIALENMRTNLKDLARENEIRTWLLKGTSELNDKIRGDKDIKTLAQDAVSKITAYLNAQMGAIYLNDGSQLVLTGSYAFQERKSNANSFQFGQGLVGQAALEKKTILFTEVPHDYIRIQSGLGNVVPKNIVVFPFLYDGELKGVLELGSVSEFNELDIEFLTMVSENLAIACNTAQSRTRLQDLLEETQRQAEELETQQEELKQSNEELHEKTELLERSEAELKAQQEELQQSNEELEEKANLLEEQKDKLENAKMDIENKARELEVSGKYKSEFLANMSHELRTPLNSILILSQLLTENKSKALGEKEIEFAKNIYNSGADLLSLINEILDLSKVESGKMELEISEISFQDLSSDLQAMFSEVAVNKSIDFKINCNESAINALITDKQRLEQILRNLLSNAFKFTSKGGKVIFSMDRANGNVVFKNPALYSAANVIAFSVSDTGIGISENKLEVVFEAFQQADGSTKRKYGGTGLGLSISRELAAALGGEIHVKSKEGEGSTFILYLPQSFGNTAMPGFEHKSEVREKLLTPKNRPAVIEKLPEEDGELNDDRYNIHDNDKVVLVLEDDPEFSGILLNFLRERNYKAIIANKGNTGLSYARHYKPDAILLDMKLPVMEGTEVLKHLKNDPELRHIPVQIISGYDKRKEGLELGAFDFIRKPLGLEELRNAFEKVEDFINKKLKKLLIIEDNVPQNQAIRELIGNGDVKSFSAYSGEEAYQMMNKEKYDCLIVDLGLPDMTGFDFLEKIKSNEVFNKIPIVVYTGKDLSKHEHAKLVKYANTVVLKTADSKERLLDETMLFLHRVESRLPKDKQQIIRKLHKTDEVLKNKNVLIVDDDIRNIYSITNVLEEEGMNCITAENGVIALKTLKNNRSIDIVLMDIMMPEMDGYDATKEIRKISKYDKLPIIALTAKAMKGDREKCLSAGMSDYISKPVNIEQLLSLMRVWLYR